MLTENASGGLSAADVAAVMGGRGNNGFGWGADGGWWILLLFLFAMGGNWNNGGFGGNGAMPFMMGQATQADMQRGFDQQATQSTLAAIQSQMGSGFADAALATCQGNANTVAAITGAKDALNSTLYANQLANNQSMNSLAMALQQCLKKGFEKAKETFFANNAVGTCMA